VEESWETFDPWDWDCEDDDRLEATLIVAQNGLVAQGSTIAERVINVDWARIGLVAREDVVPNSTHCVLLPDTLASALYQFVFCPREFGTPLLSLVDDLPRRLGCELTPSRASENVGGPCRRRRRLLLPLRPGMASVGARAHTPGSHFAPGPPDQAPAGSL
jgi:hypothetical protein